MESILPQYDIALELTTHDGERSLSNLQHHTRPFSRTETLKCFLLAARNNLLTHEVTHHVNFKSTVRA